MPREGDTAPEIDLLDDDGTRRKLADQRGRYTLVYFYPRDATPGCTTEACSFRDAEREIQAAGATVWGISPQDARSHARFRDEHGLPFPLLVDAGHVIADAYGTWVEKSRYGRSYWGVARTTFLVGPDGRVARVWENVRPEGHADEVLAALREMQRP